MSENNTNTNTNVSSQVDKIGQYVDLVKIEHDDFPIRFAGVENLIRDVESARKFVRTATFESDDDRKSLNKVKALANKMVAAHKAELKDAEAEIFGPVREELKRVEASMTGLGSDIKERVEYFDRLYRDEKRSKLMDQIAERISADEKFTDLSAESLFDMRWLNRSMSLRNAIREADARFASIEAIMATDAEMDAAAAVDVLEDHEFDTAATITAIFAERKRRDEEALLAQQAERHEAERREAMRQEILREEAAKREAAVEDARREAATESISTEDADDDDMVTRVVRIPRDRVEEFEQLVMSKFDGEIEG